VLADAKLTIHDVDAVAATAGPGLIGGVMVALLAGKGLALAARKSLVAVNHLEGHALSPRLVDPDLGFPYLLLLVSGGHCQLLEVRGVGDYRRLATTIDDAAGEAFDKAAKLLGLPYPGGPAIEELSKAGDPTAVPLPRPLLGSGEPHFSFAGLKSAVQRAVFSGDHAPADIAASFQKAVVDVLVDRTSLALSVSDAPTLVVAGGVAANQAIRTALADLAQRKGRAFSVPPAWLCTDNAAMIAWAGAERFAKGLTDEAKNAAVTSLEAIAADLGITVAQLAIAWAARNPHVSTVITGASSVSQLRSNLAAVDAIPKLTPEVLARIDAITLPLAA